MKSTAYLFSAKKGVPSFTYRELELLQQKDVRLTLLVTKQGKIGKPLNSNWDVVHVSKKCVVFGVLSYIQKISMKKMAIALEAVRDRNFHLFLVALGFYHASGARLYSSIHVQMADHKLAIGYYLARVLDIPITAKIHAHELYTRRLYDKPETEKKYLLYCKKIITISNFNKNILVNEIGIPKELIEVMYLYPSFVKNPVDQVRILIVANWVRKKGYLTLLNSFSLIIKEFPNAVLWIAGGAIDSGIEQDINVPQIVGDLGLSNHVVIFGSVNTNVIQILVSECDIFCLPSETDYFTDGRVREREGIPVSLMEAMFEGKPVITTNHAGIPELVDVNLVKEGDVGSLATAIKNLMIDPIKRLEQGQRNRTKIENNFSESNVDILVRTLNSLQ